MVYRFIETYFHFYHIVIIVVYRYIFFSPVAHSLRYALPVRLAQLIAYSPVSCFIILDVYLPVFCGLGKFVDQP